MKIAGTPSDAIKLCHASIGSVVLLVSASLEVDDEPFVVCASEATKGRRAARKGMTHGLYDDQRELFLVSLKSGLKRDLPHLSSRVIIFNEAEVTLGEETPRGSMSALKHERQRIVIGEQASPRTAEECLADFVATFAPETGPERLCFDRAKRHLEDAGYRLP